MDGDVTTNLTVLDGFKKIVDTIQNMSYKEDNQELYYTVREGFTGTGKDRETTWRVHSSEDGSYADYIEAEFYIDQIPHFKFGVWSCPSQDEKHFEYILFVRVTEGYGKFKPSHVDRRMQVRIYVLKDASQEENLDEAEDEVSWDICGDNLAGLLEYLRTEPYLAAYGDIHGFNDYKYISREEATATLKKESKKHKREQRLNFLLDNWLIRKYVRKYKKDYFNVIWYDDGDFSSPRYEFICYALRRPLDTDEEDLSGHYTHEGLEKLRDKWDRICKKICKLFKVEYHEFNVSNGYTYYCPADQIKMDKWLHTRREINLWDSTMDVDRRFLDAYEDSYVGRIKKSEDVRR